MRKLILLSFIISFTFSVNSIIAQEQISGPQSGILGPGEYQVVGDIQVVQGGTLEILPGTEFYHMGDYKWDIYGCLIAEGNSEDSIIFVPFDTLSEYRWGGIRFDSSGSDESIIDYCIIDNGDFPYPQLFFGDASGIYILGLSITISNSRISNWNNYGSGGGIYAFNSSFTVENCLIVNNLSAMPGNSGGGISIECCDGAGILYNVIAYNIGDDG